jgi:hypothetical protein
VSVTSPNNGLTQDVAWQLAKIGNTTGTPESSGIDIQTVTKDLSPMGDASKSGTPALAQDIIRKACFGRLIDPAAPAADADDNLSVIAQHIAEESAPRKRL